MEFDKNIVFEDAFILFCRIFLHGGRKRTLMENENETPPPLNCLAVLPVKKWREG